MLEKYNKLQPKHKITDELKVALQTVWKELPNASTMRWRTSPSAWLSTWLWLPMVHGHSKHLQ